MRVGSNPAFVQSEIRTLLPHRIIVPVYIPHLEDYFRYSLEVLRLCLESLWRSVREKASITVIANGCDPEVIAELDRRRQDGRIDQLLLNRHNEGKVDAVVGAARGAFEDLITISDCDVLFKDGWLEAVEEVFCSFPECGVVSPAPNPGLGWYHTSATILGSLARRELSFAKVVPDSDLDRFAESIGWPDMFRVRAHPQMVLRRNGALAAVGSGHFVCTIRRAVVSAIPREACRRSLSGSEEKWLDIPPDALGFWRLSTCHAYAYHMGNVPEEWMFEELQQAHGSAGDPRRVERNFPMARKHWTGRLPWRLRKVLVRQIRPLVQHLAAGHPTV